MVLRWHIEHRIVAIPRSANADRIAENADIFGFALTSAEVEILDSFASGVAREVGVRVEPRAEPWRPSLLRGILNPVAGTTPCRA